MALQKSLVAERVNDLTAPSRGTWNLKKCVKKLCIHSPVVEDLV